ncbi:MAG: hypothetical protein RLY87_1858 [Chloroflexota bacterium]
MGMLEFFQSSPRGMLFDCIESSDVHIRGCEDTIAKSLHAWTQRKLREVGGTVECVCYSPATVHSPDKKLTWQHKVC